MIRRIVCLMLVPALLANQAAMCCAHTHHGGDTDDHSARSHIHLSGETHASHSDSHHHGESGEHKHSDELPIESSETNLEVDATLPVDHDNDALFFGEHGNLQNPSNRVSVDGPSFATLFFDTPIPRVAGSEHRTETTRAGPFTLYYCAIFLHTRRLLL